MRRQLQDVLYVGIKNHVIALNRKDGAEIWRSKLKNSEFTTVFFDGTDLYAANGGEVFRLDPDNGAILWHNKLKGMGFGVVSLARAGMQSGGSYENIAMQKKREAAQGAAAAAG